MRFQQWGGQDDPTTKRRKKAMATAKFDSINVEEFEKWLTALESGEIQQGTGELHTTNDGVAKMCCLGVASHKFADMCDLSVVVVNDFADHHTIKYNKLTSYAPRQVMDHLGIPEDHLTEKADTGYSIYVTVSEDMSDKLGEWGISSEVGTPIDVAVLNDNGFSFTEIASLLRKEFLNA